MENGQKAQRAILELLEHTVRLAEEDAAKMAEIVQRAHEECLAVYLIERAESRNALADVDHPG